MMERSRADNSTQSCRNVSLEAKLDELELNLLPAAPVIASHSGFGDLETRAGEDTAVDRRLPPGLRLAFAWSRSGSSN
jgi:hypothetical protein